MARKVALSILVAVYHVMSRGNHQEAIFRDDQDRQLFPLANSATATAIADTKASLFLHRPSGADTSRSVAGRELARCSGGV
jgi:hypothetical protein